MLFKEKLRFCPACGSAHWVDHDFKSKRCNDCGFILYHNASAAVAAFIENERHELLVCRRAYNPACGTLDLPGGFVDYAETAEQAIAREVAEETGLKLVAADYLFSLPNNYFYADLDIPTLDMFFRCRVAEGQATHAADDVAECFYVPVSELHYSQFGLASVSEAVKRFVAERNNQQI